MLLAVVAVILQNVWKSHQRENEVYIMTTNSSVESAKAGENERTGNDFCYFLDKKFSDYGKLEFLSQRI